MFNFLRMSAEVKPSTETRWLTYFTKYETHTPLNRLWMKELKAWVLDRPRLAQSRLLDYGCGHFDLGLQISSNVGGIDGYDANTPLVLELKSRLQRELPTTLVFPKTDDIPLATYDLIVMNSVSQYLGTRENLRMFFRRARQWSKPSGELLISDIIPVPYSPARDAIRSLVFSSLHGMLLPMIRHLYFAVRNPSDTAFLQIDAEELFALAHTEGWKGKRLPRNLTPSNARYTAHFTQDTQ